MKRPMSFILVLVFGLLAVFVPNGVNSQQALAAPLSSESFIDNFDSPTLDPAWQVVQYAGSRVYGYTSPANHFSLSANPGSLRYLLDPMTHYDGFLNGFQPTSQVHSNYDHDPGLELRRSFGGDAWVFTSKVTYYMPATNGRGLDHRLYFGNGGTNTYYVSFGRGRDDPNNWNRLYFRLAHKAGPNLSDVVFLQEVTSPVPSTETFYYKLTRNRGILTAQWGTDGITWQTVFRQDLGAQLDGLDQRLIITGLSWFNTASSFADYDFVKLQPTWELMLPIIIK